MMQNSSSDEKLSAFKPLKQEDLELGEAPSRHLQIDPNFRHHHNQTQPIQNPFYIDKIFNFQNMFLFSNPTLANTTDTSLNHQNFLQNLYGYYNNINNNNAQKQTQTKEKRSFSIESILSTPNSNSNSQIPTPKVLPQVNYSSLLAAHQFYSQMSGPQIANLPSRINPNIQKPIINTQQQLPQASKQSVTRSVDTKSDMVPKSKNAKKYKCDLCGRGFSRSNTLITHRRIHTGEKPFECNICGRAFRQPGNLTRHKLTHTTIKPYSCNKCGKSFNRVSNLHAHIKIHSDGKPFVCVVCNAGFYQKIDLKIHSLTHTDDKIHECTFCKRTFKQAAHLKYHLHTHLNESTTENNEIIGTTSMKREASDTNSEESPEMKRVKLEPQESDSPRSELNETSLNIEDDESENDEADEEDDDEDDVYDSQE